jgi:CHAT domain-containing protein
LVTEITPSRSHYLIERYPISYAASASLLNPALLQPRAPHKGALAFANPDFSAGNQPGFLDYLKTMASYILRDDKLLPLPFSEVEAKAIAKEISASEIYIGKKATEEKYKAAAGEFRFIHLATHNILNDQRPMLSRLIFAQGAGKNEDGFYYMYEIFNLRLNADLVVLSACNTGLGKFSRGEGLIGMSRAFMYAGVPSVVASLWWVEDEATAFLMQRFYKYLKAGLGKNAALQRAKIDMINTTGEEVRVEARNPFYWAPFILIGDSGPVQQK